MSDLSIRRLLFAVSSLAVAAVFDLASDDTAAAESTDSRLVYSIVHPTYGNIGTYTNLIEKTGDTTTVTTSGQIKVAILGTIVYRQDISRVELWHGDRLVSFHGVTTVNGKPFEVNGVAEGDHFKVTTPDNTVTAPESIKVANPWSEQVLMGDTILTPDTGEVETVQISPGVDAGVAMTGRVIPATQFKIDCSDGHTRYDVWLDQGGTPVMFDVVTPGNRITFHLMA